MRNRGLLLLLLASALTFLASLYLPWETAPPPTVAPTGWQPWFGQAAGLVALALAAGTAAALVRPDLQARLPLARGAFVLAYFGLFVWAELRALGMYEQAALAHESVGYGSGAYLGVAGVFVALLAAQALRRDELARSHSPVAVAGTLLTLGLLAAFIVPQLRVHVPPHGSPYAASGFLFASFGVVPTIFAAAVPLFGLPFWVDGRRARERLAVAAATAVLTGATLSLVAVRWTSYSWLALICSLGLVALALAESGGLRLAVPSWTALGAGAAAVLLVVTLFLRWEHSCISGSCYSASGWQMSFSAVAGGLAVVLVLLLLVAGGAFASELALTASALLLATGFSLTEYSNLAYGAPLGFAGAALLLLALAFRLRPFRLDLQRLLVRLVPLAACTGFLAIAVVPLTGRLSPTLELEAPWRLLSLQVAAVLLAFRLLGRWLAGTDGGHKLVVLPLALLALTALDLVYARGEGIGWGGLTVVGLCLLLALCGRWAQVGGIPEILRIDRLAGSED